MKNKILLFITINIFICCSYLFSQHWEFIPSFKGTKYYDSTFNEENDLFSPAPFLVTNDTLICSNRNYICYYYNNNWKLYKRDDIIKSSIKDTALANYLINNNPGFWKTDYANNKFIFKIMTAAKEYSYSKYKITIFYDIDKQYKSIDKIYDKDSNKCVNINNIKCINTDKKNNIYLVLQTYDDDRPKIIEESKVRICKVEADTLKTLNIFYYQNLFRYDVSYLLKFDHKNNLWVNSRDILYYYENDKPIKKFSLTHDISNDTTQTFNIKDLFITKDNNIVAVDWMGDILYYDDNKWTIDSYVRNYNNSYGGYNFHDRGIYKKSMGIMDNNENLYITTAAGNFIFKKHKNGKWEHLKNLFSGILYLDNIDRIWMFGQQLKQYKPDRIDYSIGIYYIKD